MPADIYGIKFADWNRDGIKQDSEPALNGFTIFLDKPDGDGNFNGVLDDGEESVISGTTGRGGTAVTGGYYFPNVQAGEYRIDEVRRSRWIPTNLPDPVIVPGDVGNFADSCIDVYKYYDSNGNGIRDEGETLLDGITVVLAPDRDRDGVPDADGRLSAVTGEGEEGEEGKVSFDELQPGTYFVWEELDQIYKPTTPDMVTVDLGQGEKETVEFGNAYKEGMLTLCKFLDENENGRYDPGEMMLPDWDIEIWEDTNRNDMFDPGELLGRVTTGEDGCVMFMVPMDNALGRTVFVREVPRPEQQQQGFPANQ